MALHFTFKLKSSTEAKQKIKRFDKYCIYFGKEYFIYIENIKYKCTLYTLIGSFVYKFFKIIIYNFLAVSAPKSWINFKFETLWGEFFFFFFLLKWCGHCSWY